MAAGAALVAMTSLFMFRTLGLGIDARGDPHAPSFYR
jgi:hypothetical protein